MPIPIYYNNEPYVPSPLAPEGVPTVADTATMEDLTPAGRELLERYRKSAKERAKREELAQRGYTTIIGDDGKDFYQKVGASSNNGISLEYVHEISEEEYLAMISE